MTTLTYHAGSNSSPIVNVRNQLGAVVNLSTATRFVAVFYGTDTANNFTVDTDIDAGTITGDSDGNVTFVLSGVSVTEDEYVVNLTVYDAAHTNGQQLADECCGPYLCMKICGSAVVVAALGAYFEVEIIDIDSFASGSDIVTIAAAIYNTGEGPDMTQAVTGAGWAGTYGVGADDNDELLFFADQVNITSAISQTGISRPATGGSLKIAVSGTDIWIGKKQSAAAATDWYDSTGGTTGDPATLANPTISSVPSQTWLAFGGLLIPGS